MVSKKRFLFYFLCWVLFITSCKITRDPSVVVANPSRKFPLDLRTAEIDALGNVIALSSKNTITRYNRVNGTSVQYSDNRLGRIDVVDSRNPLELLLFFKSYGMVRWLDNSLTVIEEVNLDNSNVVNVCSSNDGKFWMFDENTQRIYKKDRKLTTLIESNRMSDLGIKGMKVIKMRESNNRLVVLTDIYGFLIFDNFGQFQRKIPNNGSTDFQLNDNLLIEFDGAGIKSTDLNQPFVQPAYEAIGQATGAIGVRVWEQDYFILFKDGIDVVSQ